MSAIDHHDDHADEPWLQHHWNNSGQQFEAGKLGMWLFLATEFLLFAGLFCAYAVYRSNHPELFEYGAKFLDWKLGATNTAVLIASSFTMAWAVTAAQRGQVKLMNGLLFITFFGGVGFLGIKYIEYTSKFKDNIYWGTALYEEVEGVTHDLTVTEEAVGDDGVMVETRFDLPAPQPENLSAVAEAPAGPGGLSAGGLAMLDAEQAEAHEDDHHDDHADEHDDHGDHDHHAHGDHGHDAGHAGHGGHDDHAHHPTEVAAALETARAVVGAGSVITMFQPHLYSRTQYMAAELAEAFSRGSDHTIFLDIFGSREDPIEGVTTDLILQKMAPDVSFEFEPDWDRACALAVARAKPGDIVLTMSTGDLYQIVPQLLEAKRRAVGGVDG